MDKPDPKVEETQKLVRRITRLAGLAFLLSGLVVLFVGGDMILGSVLTLIGVTDIVLVPHFLEKMMLAKLNQRNRKD